jgi:hypothetical protein
LALQDGILLDELLHTIFIELLESKLRVIEAIDLLDQHSDFFFLLNEKFFLLLTLGGKACECLCLNFIYKGLIPY